jgi:hypothetical protein
MPTPAVPVSRRFTPGCLMLIVGGVWLLVLGAWMVWSLFAEMKEIRTFADAEAKLVVPAQPTAEQITALRARINAFGTAVGKNQKAELRLTVDDLNALLASEEAGKSMKENAKVESIGDTLHVQISVAMNGIPFSGERLYLNGFAELTVEKIKDKGIQLATKNLTVPGKKVSEGFLTHYRENNHLDTLLMDGLRASKDPAIMEVMKKLTTVRLEPGAVIMEYAP